MCATGWPGDGAVDPPPGAGNAHAPQDVALVSRLCADAWCDVPGLSSLKPEIVWVQSAPTILAVISGRSPAVEVAADALASALQHDDAVSRRGVELLLKLAGSFASGVLTDETGDADRAARGGLQASLDVWDGYDYASRRAVYAALDVPAIDAGGIFSQFLRIVSSDERRIAAGESEPEWRKRWITWLLGQMRIDLPYDRDAVADILLDDVLDPDESRLALYQAIRPYDRQTEHANAERVSRDVAWAEQELLFGRMSRAFHNQALLFANARYVTVTRAIASAARRVIAATSGWPEVRPSADRLRLMMRLGAETPFTEMVGALDHLEELSVRHQKDLVNAELERRREGVERRDDSDDPRIDRRIGAIMRAGGKILRATGDLRARLLDAPHRPAAYLIMSQRPSPTGAHLLAKINAGEEPFLGKAENLRRLVPESGDRIYASPDYSWLEHANHWIEAIPLFIKERIRVVDGVEVAETVIDQEGMEESFREQMADPWALNCALTEMSGWCAIARAMLLTGEPASADIGIAADLPRAWRMTREGRTENVALLASLVAFAASGIARQISARAAEDDGERRTEVALELLYSDDADLPELWTRVRAQTGSKLPRVLRTALAEAPDEVRAAVERRLPDARRVADRPRRPVPTLHVLTTQSANMTNGYVRSWVEESVALYGIVRDVGLEPDVRAVADGHRREIDELGAVVIAELGLDVEIDTLVAAQGIDRPVAIRRLIGANSTVQSQVALLAVLRESSENLPGGALEPPAVDRCAAEHRDELVHAAIGDVVERNPRDISAEIDALRSSHPSLTDEELRRNVVEANDDYRADLETFVRFAARECVLESLAGEHPEWKLVERRKQWLRRHQRLSLTTARKQAISERGLNHLTLDPRYHFEATGGNKRFNLIYTPSRVDLGPRERESVETWAQWVGGCDREAGRTGRRVYGLINKSVKRFDSLGEPEVLKTGENASMASHFAYSNAMALMVNATGRGDFEDLGDQMSLREDRKIHPAGEGYGGYCVPKDGLFLEFVLTLTEDIKLRQLGVDDRHHAAVSRLARHVLRRRDEFDTDFAWEHWAEQLIADEKALGEVFGLRESERGDRIPVFQITRLARVLDTLGQPPLTGHGNVVRSLSARWGIHTMIAGAEHVNRFMPFYKTWLTYDAIASARRESDGKLPAPEDAVIVLSAEYKPDTQDGRFAVGMRKYEIFAGTDDHLRYSLGEEAGLLSSLMIDGWESALSRRGPDDPGLRKIARRWGLEAGDASTTERMREVFPGYRAPAEIRLVSSMGLSTQDVLRYTSDTRIEDVADAVRAEFNAAGLSDDEIDTNIRTFGPHIEKWARLRGSAQVDELRAAVGRRIHALTLAVLGPDRSYERALQGSDVFDVGIAHRQVLELLDEPAHLADLMLHGRPGSPLIIVDGGSGARRRAMSRLGVMRWFAAGDQRGRRSVYRSIGLGDETIEEWRGQMVDHRDRAERLWDAWCSGERERAMEVFRRVVEDVRDDQEALLGLEEEERLSRFGRDTGRDHIVAELLTDVAQMDDPSELGFMHWIALGGMFILEGRLAIDIEQARDSFDDAAATLFDAVDRSHSERLYEVVRSARPGESAGFRQEGNIESSNKATEEVSHIALDTRSALAERAQRMLTLRARLDAFEQELAGVEAGDPTTPDLIRRARENLGALEEFESERAYGTHLALTRVLAERLSAELCAGDPAEAEMVAERFGDMFTGREFNPDAVRLVVGGYEDIGAIGRLGQGVIERAAALGWSDDQRRAKLDDVATLAEFVDIAQVLEATLVDRRLEPDEVDVEGLWRSLASFYAETLNDHFYEYRPWAYSRGVGFDEYSDDALYGLAGRHHRWLYRYVREIITTRTGVRSLEPDKQDLLIGRWDDDGVFAAIAMGGDDSEAERRWRAYNQLREIAFIRNDGFPLPAVMSGFDPGLIDADNRVNILAAYPVGRTHVSSMLAEGPTLARELAAKGERAANIILARVPEIAGGRVVVRDGHLYVEREVYAKALMRHDGRSESDARRMAARDATPKGVRLAVRFTRPVTVATMLPMHGNPLYDSGETERLGLPCSVQSRFHTWTTYDKAKYPDMFRGTSVHIPDEIDWLASWTAENQDEALSMEQIRDGRPGTDYAGLAEFGRTHRVAMVKDAAESGGRSQKAFELSAPDGELDEAALSEATEFLYQISLVHNVAVQEVVLSSPELWATEQFMQRFTDRQIIEWQRPIVRDRRPRTPLFGSFRVIYSTDRPLVEDRREHWHPSHRLVLNSTQLITNIGRGGTLELLRPKDDIRPEVRAAVVNALDEAGRSTMEAMADYERRRGDDYQRETDMPIGKDLTGVSYGIPRYLMLDFLVRPVFDRPGELVDVEPVVDAAGRRTGSRFIVHGGDQSSEANILDWEAVLIEPNIGVGLWDRVTLREIEHEKERAEAAQEEMNWDHVGENARTVLRDFTRAGGDYLVALEGKDGD